MTLRKRLPGLLLGLTDGGSLERRVLRLLEARASWALRWRVVSAVACFAVMGMGCICTMTFGIMRVDAQSPGEKILNANEPRPTAEVATIKPSFFVGRGYGSKGPDVFYVKGATVKDLIQMAYGLKADNQLEGLSGWTTSDKFDVEVKLTREEVALQKKLAQADIRGRDALVLQTLLESRFGLKTSQASRMMQVYDLTVVKGGTKLKPSAMVDDAERPGKMRPAKTPMYTASAHGNTNATAQPISMLSEILGRLPELGGGDAFSGGRVIVDKTGLNGLYDWSLEWTPTSSDGQIGLVPTVEKEIGMKVAPGLFTALEEQLGLKLTTTKAPVEVLVVGQVQRPTEN